MVNEEMQATSKAKKVAPVEHRINLPLPDRRVLIYNRSGRNILQPREQSKVDKPKKDIEIDMNFVTCPPTMDTESVTNTRQDRRLREPRGSGTLSTKQSTATPPRQPRRAASTGGLPSTFQSSFYAMRVASIKTAASQSQSGIRIPFQRLVSGIFDTRFLTLAPPETVIQPSAPLVPAQHRQRHRQHTKGKSQVPAPIITSTHVLPNLSIARNTWRPLNESISQTSMTVKSSFLCLPRPTTQKGSIRDMTTEDSVPTHPKRRGRNFEVVYVRRESDTRLPALVIHFEGVLGCCTYLPTRSDHRDFFVLGRLRETIENLMRTTRVYLILPNLESSGKRVYHYLTESLQDIDGIFARYNRALVPCTTSTKNLLLDYTDLINILGKQSEIMIINALQLENISQETATAFKLNRIDGLTGKLAIFPGEGVNYQQVFVRDIRSQLQFYTVESFEREFTAEYLLEISARLTGVWQKRNNGHTWAELSYDAQAQRQLTRQLLQESVLKAKLPSENEIARRGQPRISLEHTAKENILNLMRETIPHTYRDHNWKVADMFFRNRDLTNLLQTNKFYTDPRIGKYLTTLYDKLEARNQPENVANRTSKTGATRDTTPNGSQKGFIEDVDHQAERFFAMKLLYFNVQ